MLLIAFDKSSTSEGAVFTIETSVLGSRKTPAIEACCCDGDDDDGDDHDGGVVHHVDDLLVEGMELLVSSLKEGSVVPAPVQNAEHGVLVS